MALRLIEIVVPSQAVDELYELLQEHKTLGSWTSSLEQEIAFVRILLPSTDTEAISDAIVERFEHHDGFRLLFYAIEATIPQPELEEETPQEEVETEDEVKLRLGRISREELYADLVPDSMLSATYLITVALSTLVAAIGLLFDDVAIIIGAMVIAPLLRPNVALALAFTLGDIDLVKKTVKTSLAGIVLALFLAMGIGFLFGVDPDVTQIANRTNVAMGHVVLALAVGVAGALSFTTGVSSALIGVMVAVALLPPLVTAGLLAGAGYGELAGQAFVLALINITGISLASIVTFLVQGIRPRQWWEAEKAKQATRYAIVFGVVLLVAFVGLVFLFKD